MPLETRLSKINFAGQDGFNWFIGQVTSDAAWREHSEKWGYRVKVRIFGKHPPSTELPDADLPWAHVLVPATFGAGKAFAGTTMMLQGGETVSGYFLDGEEAQQPVIIGCFHTSNSVLNQVKRTDEPEGSSAFLEMFPPPNFDYTEANLRNGGVDNGNGIINENGLTASGYISKQLRIDEERITVPLAKDCKGGKGFLSEVSRSLASFISITNGLNRLDETYIDPIMNELRDVRALVRQTSYIISNAYSQVIRLARKYLFDKIYKLVEQILGLTQLDSLLKDIAVKKSIDTIYCVIENIIKGLSKFIEDFLMELIGKLVHAPLCAAEQFIGGINSKLFNDIEKAIGSAMNAIQGILGPVGSFMGFLDKAMGYAQIGLNLLKCDGDICEPEPYDWALNFGPIKQNQLDFSRAIDISSKFNVAGIGKSLTDRIDSIFPEVDEDGVQKISDIVGDCNPHQKICGPPKIEIFGGGGIGAAANAVVNNFGQIVGVNMTDLGFGYTKKPYVTILDECDNGRGATGEAILEDGKVINIIIRTGGGGYNTPPQTSDDTGIPVVGEIDGIEVIRTGLGYSPYDIISSQCGSLRVKLDDAGRIIGADVIEANRGCTVIPNLTINTETGFGALVRPIMKFRKLEEYDDTIPEKGIINVVDCVGAY